MLPRLLQGYLQQRSPDLQRELAELRQAQGRTHRLLQSAILVVLGFALGGMATVWLMGALRPIL
jgi:hypothetical protein